MTDPTPSPAELARIAVQGVLADLRHTRHRGLVVDSPPGAGKTTLVVQAVRALVAAKQPCIVIAQTNHQVNDLVRRLAAQAPDLQIGRLTAHTYTVPHHVLAMANTHSEVNIGALDKADVVIATARKWASVRDRQWPWAIIDEAYQMRSDALLLIAELAHQTLFVGDPGQLDPFSTIDTPRWLGLPHDPMNSAVAVLLQKNPDLPVHSLPVSWRLPPSAADIVSKAFYPFTGFSAGTHKPDRRMEFATAGMRGPLDETVDLAALTGWALLELPARHTARIDPEASQAAADVATRLLTRHATTFCENEPDGRALEPADIAIGTAHRDQARHIQQILHRQSPNLTGITVDTANRLQGREYAVTIVVHPLSGRRDASAFHLEAGRLCVLTSRHRHACIVIARAGIADLLDAHPSTDPVHLGVPAKFPDGWEANQHVLAHLSDHRIRGT
ncbi:AAA domain-containing protein [Streptomyces sp. NPDC050507]|uniref:AAA domain-containing protein n=1 Tax=Streptomyces sp. NPDC050507 TaxID=3365619 RepID=UPI00379F4B15